MRRSRTLVGVGLVAVVALGGCAAPGALDDSATPEPSASAPEPSASAPVPSASGPVPSASTEPEGIDTSDWLTYANTEGDMTYRYPADWTLEAESTSIEHPTPGFHTAWDSSSLTAPNGQMLLRSGDFADIGGACPPDSRAPVEVLAIEPSSALPLEDAEGSVIATVAFPLPEGGWTFGVGVTSEPFLGDDEGMGCGVHFVSESSSGGVSVGTQWNVGSFEERSDLWEIDSLDDAEAYMETEEYATILEILRSVVTS